MLLSHVRLSAVQFKKRLNRHNVFETVFAVSIPFYVAAVTAGFLLVDRISGIAKVLLAYLVVELMVELFCYYLRTNHRHNLWLYNLFIMFETAMFGGIAAGMVAEKNFRTSAIALLGAFAMVWAGTNFIVSGISVFHPVVQVLQCLLLIFLSGYLLIKVSGSTESFFRDSRFWFASAIIIYFITTLFVAAITPLITAPGNGQFSNLWIINSVANMFSHILFVFYFVWNSRRKILYC
jgi:hypothetical protein